MNERLLKMALSAAIDERQIETLRTLLAHSQILCITLDNMELAVKTRCDLVLLTMISSGKVDSVTLKKGITFFFL